MCKINIMQHVKLYNKGAGSGELQRTQHLNIEWRMSKNLEEKGWNFQKVATAHAKCRGALRRAGSNISWAPASCWVLCWPMEIGETGSFCGYRLSLCERWCKQEQQVGWVQGGTECPAEELACIFYRNGSQTLVFFRTGKEIVRDIEAWLQAQRFRFCTSRLGPRPLHFK